MRQERRILALAFAVCALGAAIVAAVASAHHVHPPRTGTTILLRPRITPARSPPIPTATPPGPRRPSRSKASRASSPTTAASEPTIVANTEPTHGSLELEPDGGFTYTPEAGFAGADSFSYTIADAVHSTRPTCRRSAPTEASS